MSFASTVKQELCRQAVAKRCCAVAESFGVLLYCNTFTHVADPHCHRERRTLPPRLPRLFRRAFGVGPLTPSRNRRRPVWAS